METEFLKSLVRRYNKEPNINNWRLLENHIEDKHFCKDCGESIFYYNSKIRVSKGGNLYYDKTMTSCKTFKKIEDKIYHLKICQKCISNKFPEYLSMNRSRVFNVMNKITRYAFDIPEEDAKKFTQTTAVTLNNLVKKYGEDEGKERWENYRRLQAETNSLEYKKEKYGWSEEEFNIFNKSRAVTLKNMIKKYGEEEGNELFNQYVEKQRVNGKTLEYFIEKYGDLEGKIRYKKMSIAKSKGGFISGSTYSNVSQNFFNTLDNYFNKKYQTYYATKNEEKVFYIEEFYKCYILDYYIEELDVCIEFNGDYYHANPKKYSPDFFFPEFLKSAKDLWEKDDLKKELLLKYHGIKTIVVWESEYYKNKNNVEFYKKIIKKCIEI